MLDGLARREAATVFGVVQRVVEAGQDPRRFTLDLLERFRDLLLLEAVPDAPDRGMLDACPADQLDRMRSQAARLGAAELSRAADVTHAALVDMRGTTTPRMVLELLCARILLPGASGDGSSVLVRLDRIERRSQAGAGETVQPPMAPAPAVPVTRVDVAGPAAGERPAEARTEEPAAAALPEPTVSTAAGTIDLSGLRGMWPQVLEAVKTQQGGKTAHALLSSHAEVATVDGQTVTLTFLNPSIGRQFSTNGVHIEKLAEALRAQLGGTWRVVVGAPPPAPRGPTGAVDEPAPPPGGAGFAPGDEPEAEDDEPQAPTSEAEPRLRGEELAVDLLKAHMGGTVIGELDNV